jgi:MFS family permease
MSEQRGDLPGEERPGPYSGLFGATPDTYGDQQTPPKQVTIASVIAIGLGTMCLLLAILTLTSAGGQISEVLTGSRDNTPVAVAAALVCAVIYLVPALYLRKRHRWSRYMLIAVAALGIAGGIMALPASILGLAIHATLLLLMLQRPTKSWFHNR